MPSHRGHVRREDARRERARRAAAAVRRAENRARSGVGRARSRGSRGGVEGPAPARATSRGPSAFVRHVRVRVHGISRVTFRVRAVRVRVRVRKPVCLVRVLRPFPGAAARVRRERRGGKVPLRVRE